jgi:hypothetical protein
VRHFNCLSVGLSGGLQPASRGGCFGNSLQHVEFVWFALRPLHLALHGRRIAFEKSDGVQVCVVVSDV